MFARQSFSPAYIRVCMCMCTFTILAVVAPGRMTCYNHGADYCAAGDNPPGGGVVQVVVVVVELTLVLLVATLHAMDT